MSERTEMLDRWGRLLIGETDDILADHFQQEFSSMDELRAILGPSFTVNGPSEDGRIVVARMRS